MDTSDKSGELTKETPSSFSRLTPPDIQMTPTRSRKPNMVSGKRRRMSSFSNVGTSKEKPDATHPLLPGENGEQPNKKKKVMKIRYVEGGQIKCDTVTTSRPPTKAETADDKLTEYQDKFRPFDSYHWDKDEGVYRKRTGSTGEVKDNCDGSDWFRLSTESHDKALSYEKRALSDDVIVTGSSADPAINGADHEKVGQTMGSYLESLYNEWFDTKIRDEMRKMRETYQDEMEILENIRLNLQDLKGE